MAIGYDKDGKKLTNVDVIKVMYNSLKTLKEATAAEYGEKVANRMHQDYVQIAGMTPNGADPVAADRVYDFCKQIADAPDYDTANKLYMNNIIHNINID